MQQLLTDMMMSLRNRYDINDEKMVMIKEFIRVSKNDLDASRILYDHELFALAVFHLQQAVEKAIKAQCLLSGLISEKEIRTIQHESLRGQQIIANRFSELVKVHAQENPNLDVVPRLDEIMGEKRLEMARIDGNGIDTILSAYDRQIESLDIAKLLTTEKLEPILSEIRRNSPDLEISDSDAQAILDQFKELGPSLICTAENFTFLFVASAITFPHAVCTRYPGGEMSPKDYNPSLGIVNRQPELTKRFDKVIEYLELQVR
ncbi:MAG: HEPN domain-containing protein [Candidatus Thermoplasmatota archaeon]|nr:HEPN domain-containing protein [Candidatus Thermoplasmatota archaeon]